MVVQFVGFMGAFRDPGTLHPMIAGTLGGLLTTWVTFVPCFLWIFLGAPFVEALRGNRALGGALAAITAAVVGVVLNLAVWFALHVLFAELRAVEGFGISLEVPVLATIDPVALVLMLAASLRDVASRSECSRCWPPLPCRRHLLPRRRRHRLRAALDRSVRGWGAILPEGAAPETRSYSPRVGLCAVGDGLVSLLLPVYLLELGHGPFETGIIIATATLAGSALLTLLVGLYAHRASGRTLLIGAALLMMLTGVAFAAFDDFWPSSSSLSSAP